MIKGAQEMNQISFADAEYAGKRKKTRRRRILAAQVLDHLAPLLHRLRVRLHRPLVRRLDTQH